jgi:osomolarity two-component system sensor histidine kinase NIK1
MDVTIQRELGTELRADLLTSEQCATLGGPLLERGSGLLSSIPDDSERVNRVINGANMTRSRPPLEPRAVTVAVSTPAPANPQQIIELTDDDAIEHERVSQDVMVFL